MTHMARPGSVTIGARTLSLPIFFPSISSVKTALPPQEYIQFLAPLTSLVNQILVSSFDLASLASPQTALVAIARARNDGAVTLMDSGNYESFWKNAQAQWTQERFHNVLAKF